MKKTKMALLTSIIALVLCCSMLIGTTFAWFTDEVSSGVNQIVAGNLDIELEYLVDGDWKPVKADTNVFKADTLWEPGHTEVVYLRISNQGTLALKYQLGINVAGETPGINVYDRGFKLSEFIRMGVIEDRDTAYPSRQDARDAVTTSDTLASGYVTYGAMEASAPMKYIALVVYMPEEVGNEANYKTGTTAPTINLGINLLATQKTSESDSFGPNYDEGAKHPLGNINFSSTQSVAGLVDVDGELNEAVTVGNPNGDIYAEVPVGVKLEDGADSLELIVQAKKDSDADISLEDGETAHPLEIHIDGVAADNTVPMLVTLKGVLRAGLNDGNVKLYHVENDTTVAMTRVYALADLDAHNEFYYDSATGDVTLCVASFSEYDVVENDYNKWQGGFDTSWYNTTDTEFTLTRADQLAGFGKIVDGTADGIEADTFAGKTVKLGADVDMGGDYFNPIGFGYDYADYNTNDAPGKVFKGTFDGGGYTISNLYVNGWELGIEYSNSGGGLFASVCDATIKNLTMSNAVVIMECVEQGVIAGLAQGTCTFENINIYGCSVANYQRATGGVVGEVSPKYELVDGVQTVISFEHTFKDINIDSTTVIGSLWGDFDAPVGGVIGAKWGSDTDEAADVIMENVNVACRLDVYNDVTSTYQWYAYRRAGMLIGNTETSATTDGRTVATATFLTCDNVKVYYGDWVNYHYCEFNNHNKNWPFVRVEEGENCSAFSNPRWGVPNGVNGVKVTPENHTAVGDAGIHQEGDDCMVLLKFNQLYGGGQGVYGQATHDGVYVQDYYYIVTYINDSIVVKEDQVADSGVYAPLDVMPAVGDKTVEYWENAYSQEISSIPAGNMTDYTLYPKIKGEYIVRFLTSDETVIGWGKFDANGMITMYHGNEEADNTTTAPDVPDIGEDFEGYWVTTDGTRWENWSHSGVENDVLFYAYYNSGTLNLTPIYENGVQVAYAVSGLSSQEKVDLWIPDYVNGYPITTISANAFAGFGNMEDIYIPHTVTEIGQNAFCANKDGIFNSEYPMIQIIYDGTKAEWEEMVARIKNDEDIDWDDNIGRGSQIVCLREAEEGYFEQVGYNLPNRTAWEWQVESYPTWFTEGYPDLVPSN